uniref:RanBP2-type domain-containing protein n=1 Tax=Anopheles maculatus TaxID=74869 RepID=A0A182SXH2_9DIPT
MNRQSDGGAKVLVNVYAGGQKAEAGRVKLKKSSVQSKNVPDSRSSAAAGNNGAGISSSASTTSSSTGGGGFQSFFRWFRRDESRVLARSASGSAVTPELHDRSAKEARQQSRKSPQSHAVASIRRTPSLAEETSAPGGSGTIASRRTIDSTGSKSSTNTTTGDSVSQSASNGTHSSSPSPGPVIDCNNLSKSSSCDSILSTATNGFAFVPPNCYEAVLAKGNPEIRRTIQPGPYTDSYKRRCSERDRARELDQKYELTLRKKYRLFASLRESPVREQRDATLTRDNQRTVYADLSLPAASGTKTSTSSTAENGVDWQEPGVGDPSNRRHRRTVSDSSKDRRAGAYVHVKGKRRAPPPPPLSLERSDTGSSSTSTLTRSCTPNYRTLSPGSTLSSRKKRPAPAPPVSPTTPTLNEASSSTSLLEDREIKAIIEGRPLSLLTKEPVADPEPTLIMPLPFIRPLSPLPNIAEERAPPGGLTEEQKQQLIDNIRKVQSQVTAAPKAPDTPPTPTNADDPCDVMKMEEQFNRTNGTRSPIHDYLYAEAMASAKSNSGQPSQQPLQPPTSPISPRPWYKRPLSGVRQQESSLPFKRDIILKTIDKRKAGNGKHGKDAGDDLPEVGYFRNSMLHQDSTGTHSNSSGSPSSSLSSGVGKFNLFAKITEKSDDTKRRERDAEKRRSAIGIPSISELDREAAEIVHNEYRYNGTDKTQSLEGQQAGDKQKSTKELISKFEATSVPVAGKVTVSSSFVARRDYFGLDATPAVVPPESSTSTPSNASATVVNSSTNEKPTPPQSTTNGLDSQAQSTATNGLAKTGSDKNLLGLWTCPYCTLENPNWRIICEACERIKPYDSKLSILEEPPLRPNHPLKRPIPDAKKLQPTVSQTTPSVSQTGDDLDKKTERVLKYFMPKPLAAPATNGTLLVGGNGDDRVSLVQRKPSYGQTKPLASPKMGVKSLMNRTPHPDGQGAMYRNFNAIPESYHNGVAGDGGNSNKFDDQKLKESHGVTNGTVSVAPLASPEPTTEKEDTVYGVLNKPYSPKDRVNIEEIRNARIARFGAIVEQEMPDPVPVINETISTKTKEQQDQEALEKEKERLREMIHAMNAKALAEKYPVVQKPPPSNSGNSSSLKRDSPLVQRKNGLTSGIPISTKSLSPVPPRKMGS